ncbi:MAG: hypothetical protein ACHQWU_15740 [Gemmatimonadales bacterium]
MSSNLTLSVPTRFAVAAIAVAMFVTPAVAQQPVDSLRLVVATGSTCHSLPDEQAPIAERYHLGDVVGASKSTRGSGNQTWYFDAWRVMGISPTCWVPASATTPFDPRHHEASFAAVVDRVLARGDSASFESLVEAENFLEAPNPYAGVDRSPLDGSPLLHFRRLLLIERAASRLDTRRVDDAPLERAWLLAHSDLLVFYDSQAIWHIDPSAYWKLYDANVVAPWADELAWHAAQLDPPGDECGADCYLAWIGYGPQQYWTRRPMGASIDKALVLGARLASDAIGAVGEEPPTRAAIDAVRASLARVESSAKRPLLDRLTQLDRAVKR